ncbi:MAG TPA: hypothetical protein VLA61_21350 [Ideonella sp.]|uniref:hypothetical protein n=1 Tax=Ideonella sp. TaxID=1929293 RepID=UPI002BEAFC64|nr:hypothetical protein [Ideonella sp.]HSI50821.1 hypothetical protein [Ideonella sp.]
MLPSLANATWLGMELTVASYKVGPEPDGSRVYVAFNATANPEGCTSHDVYMRINGSTKKGQYHLAMINMAVAMSKHVTVSLSGCDDWGYPVISELNIY